MTTETEYKMGAAIAGLRAENAELAKKLAAYEAQEIQGYLQVALGAHLLSSNGPDEKALILRPTDTTHLEAIKQQARDEGLQYAADMVRSAGANHLATAIEMEIKDKP